MPDQRLHFEHFEILTDDDGSPVKLGRGGMGTTYKAFDTRRRKHVALKIIDDKLLADRTGRRRFFNEARAASNLDHPNIVRVDHVCSEDAAECFYAMEWVDGESLAERVKSFGALPPREALLLLRAVADALTVLGEQRLVHRDIKPDNIMIARAGRAGSRVKLIDFGLAKALENAADRFTSVDTGERFVGSVSFASPEQIDASGELDGRSDFYSLGATLWWVLTTSPPFTGNIFKVQKGHIEDEPPWEKIAPFPGCIQTLLRRLLAKDPAQRPPDAETLLAEWDAALTDLEPASPQHSQDETRSAGDSQPHPITPTPAPLPDGCAAPPPSAHFARDPVSGDGVIVRALPDSLALAFREEFLTTARAARAAPHSSLLGVREVGVGAVVSDWPSGITAAQVLGRQRGALSPAVVLAWLPKLAKGVDWARERGFSRLVLCPTRWLISFENLDTDETPFDRVRRPPGEWGAHYLALDPLAGFDSELAAATTTTTYTQVAPSTPPLVTPADFLAALARAIYDLLGGRPGLTSPLPALDVGSNELLLATLQRHADFSTAREWAAAFAECATRERKPPPTIPQSQSTQPPPRSMPKPASSREDARAVKSFSMWTEKIRRSLSIRCKSVVNSCKMLILDRRFRDHRVLASTPFLMRWVATMIAVALSVQLTDMRADGWLPLIFGAVLLAILNAVFDPVLRLLGRPLAMVMFGFFILVVNPLMLLMVADFVPGLHVDGFWNAFFGSIIISFVTWPFSAVFKVGDGQ